MAEKDQSGYADGHEVGSMMKAQRDEGDSSYDCRFDLADAAKKPGGYFDQFKQGLEDGLEGN